MKNPNEFTVAECLSKLVVTPSYDKSKTSFGDIFWYLERAGAVPIVVQASR